MRTFLIAGNWKMYKTLTPARALISALREGIEKTGGSKGVEVLICPPVHLLFPAAKAVSGSPIMLGAQNVHEAKEGAFTGEISVEMLADTGATHVIIGHSERRHIFGETGERLAKKVRAAIAGGLKPIYCVGETLEDREAGRTEAVVGRQLEEVLAGDIDPAPLTIAYEPVWAIGTGKTATPEQAQEVHAFIRPRLAGVFGQRAADSMRILYGGSVKPGNAADLLGRADIDGALVGGACLVADDFLAIIAAAAAARF
jgi:triosephosphate isomerase